MLATLNLAGWIFMLVSTIGTTALTVWCFWRILRLPPQDGEPG